MICQYPCFNLFNISQNKSMYHFTSISPSHLCSFSVYCLVWRILSRSVKSSLHNKLPTLVQQGLTDMPLACEDGQPVEAHQVILTLFSCSVFPSYPLPFLSKPKITNLKEHCPTQCSVVCMTLPPKLSRQIIWNVGRKKIQRFDSKTASKMHVAQQVFSISFIQGVDLGLFQITI